MNEYIKLDSGKILFSSIPKTPAVTPTEDYEVANKKYVDDAVADVTFEITETTITSSSTPTPARTGQESFFTITALATDATIAAPSGTPSNGDMLLFRIKDDGTARSLGWNVIYRKINQNLPAITVAGKVMYLGFVYNSQDSKWDYIGGGIQA